MKRILPILFLMTSNLFFSQTNYKEIKTEKLNLEKVQLAQNFIKSYLDKCSNKDYSEFTDFKLSKGHENFVKKKIKEICLCDEKMYGQISIENLNSAYKNKASLLGGEELYIYNASTEKNKDIKYLSVWISNENIIEGMVITSYKPFRKRN